MAANADKDLARIIEESLREQQKKEEEALQAILKASAADPAAEAVRAALEADFAEALDKADSDSQATAEIEAIARYNEDAKREQEHLAVLMKEFEEEDAELEMIRAAKLLEEAEAEAEAVEIAKDAARKHAAAPVQIVNLERKAVVDAKVAVDKPEENDIADEDELLRRALALSLALNPVEIPAVPAQNGVVVNGFGLGGVGPVINGRGPDAAVLHPAPAPLVPAAHVVLQNQNPAPQPLPQAQQVQQVQQVQQAPVAVAQAGAAQRDRRLEFLRKIEEQKKAALAAAVAKQHEDNNNSGAGPSVPPA